MMTPKERMQAALNFDSVDRNPAYVLDGSSWVIKEENMNYIQQYALDDAGADMIVKHFNRMKSDVVTSGTSAWMAWANTFGSEVNLSNVGTTISTGSFIKDITTDIPDLTDDQLRDKLLANNIVQTMIKQNKEVKKLVGEEKMIVSFLTAPFTAASTAAGANLWVRMLGKKDPNIGKLLEFSSRTIAILADLYYEAGADIIATADPVASGDMISPMMYKKYAVPAYKDFQSRLKNDIPLFMHICGSSGKRVEPVRDLGVKVYSVDSMVDMEECLAKADHKICMMGNLSPAGQMIEGTPESVYAESMRLLELGRANGGGFLLSTGCDLPAGSPIENILAMTKACEDFAEKYK